MLCRTSFKIRVVEKFVLIVMWEFEAISLETVENTRLWISTFVDEDQIFNDIRKKSKGNIDGVSLWICGGCLCDG